MSGARATWTGSVVAVALTATLALTGCSRLGASAGETSAPAPPAAAITTSAPAAPDAATLGSISSDLSSAGTANTEADSNASAGDRAAAQDDNG
jgi:hypothetical protein